PPPGGHLRRGRGAPSLARHRRRVGAARLEPGGALLRPPGPAGRRAGRVRGEPGRGAHAGGAGRGLRDRGLRRYERAHRGADCAAARTGIASARDSSTPFCYPRSAMAPLGDLELMIQSRYPFIAVETAEEDRLETTLSQVAGDLRVPFFVWTLTNGLHRFGL